MSDELITIATFDNVSSAQAARLALEAEGITVAVMGQIVDSLWHLGPANGVVRLQVKAVDAERADKILRHADIEIPLIGSRPPEAWRCLRCAVVMEPNFEVCWSCGQPKSEVQDASFDPSHSVDDSEVEHEEDGPSYETQSDDSPLGAGMINPYAASGTKSRTSTEAQFTASEESDAIVRRAFRASVFGLGICPGPIHLYSLYLLLTNGFSPSEHQPRVARQFYFALVIDLLTIAIVGMIFLSMGGRGRY